ncbi:unnamed protein product [Vicia faba]|uniref:F-box domain-containing protein n=1 Tax=Vicia faba TaxID=3906 RepID=A0AAV0ZY34_VICFA|nr:unnamed protein product [Vicia faba]
MYIKPVKVTRLKMTDIESDRISCFPDQLIDKILSYLPIKDAGRTSVLSRKWGKKWSIQPNLVFDKRSVSTLALEHLSIIRHKFLRMIDRVLLLHSGPINKFKLSNSGSNIMGVNSLADIRRWILHLTGSLCHLKLYYCCLKPPMTFEGFRNLRGLELEWINIHAPNLKIFHFFGNFEDISFENSSQLSNIMVILNIYVHSERNQRILHGCSNNLLKLFDHQPHIERLVIGDYFLKYLAAGVVPVKLPTPYMNLTYLGLLINFIDSKEISVVLCLLKSSPNIREFTIFAIEKQPGLLTPASYYFIKYLLLYSPVLENMIVKPTQNVKPELMTKLICFKRASSQAEVIYRGKDS